MPQTRFAVKQRLTPLILTVTLILAACSAATPSPTMTATPLPTARPLMTSIPTAVGVALATLTPSPTIAPTQNPTSIPTPIPTLGYSADFVIGQSAGGRAINGQRFGRGGRALLLVGGIHGGWERNTVALMDELSAHFANTPSDILPGISIYLIRSLNPDGLARGTTIDGRFNDNRVDLNRNWGCGWSPEAVWREGAVDPGASPFSEPETQALATFIEGLRPQVALFYHSAAQGVFAGNCDQRRGEWRSGRMALVYGAAADYAADQPFSAYPVTGTAPSWADGLGIAAADVELASSRNSEFERNLRAIMAVQAWMLE
ncbi:MAG: M14 family metallopeptidase [Phototrophicaceae bacterium]